jgi:hypothetical protein
MLFLGVLTLVPGTSVVVTPFTPKAGSGAPDSSSRTTQNTQGGFAPDEAVHCPATRILRSGCTATAAAWSYSARGSKTLPKPAPKEVSRSPGAAYANAVRHMKSAEARHRTNALHERTARAREIWSTRGEANDGSKGNLAKEVTDACQNGNGRRSGTLIPIRRDFFCLHRFLAR